MWQRRLTLVIISAVASPLVYLLGLLQPQAVLLDMPFGLAFYIADLLGMWKQGLLWGVNHRFLGILCGLGWPLLISMLVAYATAFITFRIWRTKQKYSQLYAMLFVIAVLSLILMVRVKPASYYASYYGYWTANY